MRDELSIRLEPQKVALAFMEFAAPSLADVVREFHAAGVQNVLVSPIFLSGGGHVAKDIPELVRPERLRYPEMTFAIAGAIGEEPEVTAGMLAAVARLSR